ncbi:MAG: hypothetical protein FWG50_01650 [Kiritimatiellaeota bacterium]|nr:hypothetical protein [Kiritimatiellota bacterium]
MSPKKGKRVLKDSTPSVFVGGGARVRRMFRLETREDAAGARTFFRKRARLSPFARGSAKLFHYISAGGMRQLRRTSADDLAEHRRNVFLTAVGIGVVMWLFFYFLPSA